MNPNHPYLRRRVLAAATVATLATSAGLTLGASTGAQASAGQQPSWVKLSAGSGVSTTSQPRVARWGGRLIVAWTQQVSDDFNAVNTRILGADGKPTGPTSNVATWLSASSDPQPLILNGVPTVAFGGLRTADITEPYEGELAYAQAADATSWAIGPGSLSQNLSAYGDAGFGVVDVGNGIAVSAGSYSSADHVTVHTGVDPSAPAGVPDTELAPTGSDAEQVNVARDPQTGTAYALWYSGDTDPAQLGIHSATIWPTIGTPSAPAPLSAVGYDGGKGAVNPEQDVAVTGRTGGGVWAAYASGYPSPQKVVLWHVGTSTTLSLNTTGYVKYTGVSPAPGGRLWLWWVQDQTLYAVRTNPSVTRFGAVRTVLTPATDGQAPTRTGGDGSLGPLDAVITVIGRDKNSSGDPTPEIFSTRILEGLQVTLSPAKVSYAHGGKVVATVTDAGVPVPGVQVKVGSVVVHTDRRGRAVIRVARHSGKGRHLVTAGLAGWGPGTASYTVG